MTTALLALAFPLPHGGGDHHPLHQTKLDVGGWRLRLEEAAVNGTCQTWYEKLE